MVARARIVASVVVAHLAACSAFAVRDPYIQPETGKVACGTTAPVLDILGVAASGMALALLVASVPEPNENNGGDAVAAPPTELAYGIIGVGALYGLSAIYGWKAFANCLEYRRTRSPRDYAEAIAAGAEARARAGDCAGALATGRRIERHDSAYYATVFARRPAVAKCLVEAESGAAIDTR